MKISKNIQRSIMVGLLTMIPACALMTVIPEQSVKSVHAEEGKEAEIVQDTMNAGGSILLNSR